MSGVSAILCDQTAVMASTSEKEHSKDDDDAAKASRGLYAITYHDEHFLYVFRLHI